MNKKVKILLFIFLTNQKILSLMDTDLLTYNPNITEPIPTKIILLVQKSIIINL